MTTPTITILCGAGGVGKTTLSAAFALSQARRGEQCVVVTLDPARRLQTALSLAAPLRNTPTLLREFPDSSGALYACMLDSREMWHSFAALLPHRAREALLSNHFFQTLSSKFGGAHEFMALELVARLVSEGRFSYIVLDTAPTEGAHGFLSAADRISDLLSSRIYSVAMSMADHATKLGRGVGLVTGWVTRGLRGKLEGLIGKDEATAIFEFFTLFEPLRGEVLTRAERVKDLLQQRASLMLVTTADSRGVATLRDFVQLSLPIDSIVINRTRYLEKRDQGAVAPQKSLVTTLLSSFQEANREGRSEPIRQLLSEELMRITLEEECVQSVQRHFSAQIVLIPDMTRLDDQAALVESASLSFS